jgi:hypothetical protein
MNVNSLNNRDISFNGLLNNKVLKKGLEFAADNGALFGAATTLVLSTTVRPLVILSTPNTDKKNKQVACAKSLASTLNGYLITLACSLPLARSIKHINKNPEKYLKKETIENLKGNAEKVTDSKAYSMVTQLFKLGLGFLIAAVLVEHLSAPAFSIEDVARLFVPIAVMTNSGSRFFTAATTCFPIPPPCASMTNIFMATSL